MRDIASSDRTVALSSGSRQLVDLARDIAVGISAEHAEHVDANARFPKETMDAVRRAGLLSAGLRNEPGHWCDVALQSEICFEIAKACASSAMVLAMHYIQMDCLAHHAGANVHIRTYLNKLVQEQRLIASVTSEVGVDGDLRRSIAAVSRDGDTFHLSKEATTVSYGQHAEDFLITARSSAVAAEADQVLVLALGDASELHATGEWNTLGMRGTVSPGGKITTSGTTWQILEEPFANIAPVSMVPLSHILWSACWLGIAQDALARTRKAVQKKARRDQTAAQHGAQRLASMHAKYRQLYNEHQTYLTHYLRLLEGGRERNLRGMTEIVRCNELKLNVSEGVGLIVQDGLQAAGISAYRNGAESSLGRHLRDSLSAAIMINNDRIRASNASMQLVLKDH